MAKHWSEPEIDALLRQAADAQGMVAARQVRAASAGLYQWMLTTGFDWRARVRQLGLQPQEVPGRGRVLTQAEIDAALREAADTNGVVMAATLRAQDRGLYSRLVAQGYNWGARAVALGLVPGAALDRAAAFTEAEVERHLQALADPAGVVMLTTIKKRRRALYNWIQRTGHDWVATALRAGLKPAPDAALVHRVEAAALIAAAHTDGPPTDPLVKLALAHLDAVLRAAASPAGTVTAAAIRARDASVYNWITSHSFDWRARAVRIGLAGGAVAPQGHWLQPEHLIAALREAAATLGRTPIRQEFVRLGYGSANHALATVFGSYEAALAAAGLAPATPAKTEPPPS